jgi:hypothetical protein
MFYPDICDPSFGDDTRVSYKFEIINDKGEAKSFIPLLNDPENLH